MANYNPIFKECPMWYLCSFRGSCLECDYAVNLIFPEPELEHGKLEYDNLLFNN